VVAFVRAFGMVGAGSGDHLHDGGELRAAVAAGVAWFLTALVEFVAASVGAVGMIGAGSGGELSYIGERTSAVFTIVFSHSLSWFLRRLCSRQG